MKRITKEQYTQAYKLACAISAGAMRVPDARMQLEAAGMNEASAQFYLTTMVRIIRGEYFRSTISNPAMIHVLSEIRDREGYTALQRALEALRSHIRRRPGYESRPGLEAIVRLFEGDAVAAER